jgi:hypothetical protein
MRWLQSLVVSVLIFVGVLLGFGYYTRIFVPPGAVMPSSTTTASTNRSVVPVHLNSSSSASSINNPAIAAHGRQNLRSHQTPSETRKTYTNDAYGFSISYPCKSECEFFQDQQQDYQTTAVYLPTNSDASLTVATFTDNSAAVSVGNAGENPFPFTIASIRAALQLPAGTPCKLTWYFEATSSACVVVDIAEMKTVEVAGYTRYDGSFYLNLRNDQWLEFVPHYSDFSKHPKSYYNDWPGYLSREIAPPSKLRNEIDAVSEVVNTLQVRQR